MVIFSFGEWIILAGWITCALLGLSIGAPYKMGFIGFSWGFTLGPVGLIIIVLLTMRKAAADKASSAADLDLRQRLYAAKQAAVAAAPAKGPGVKIHVRRGDHEMGEFSLSDVGHYIQSGEMMLEDEYYDFSAKDWLPLVGHPTLSIR